MTLSYNWHRTQYSLSGRKPYRLSSLLLAFYNSLVTDCFCLSKTEKLGNCFFTLALAFHTRSALPACGAILPGCTYGTGGELIAPMTWLDVGEIQPGLVSTLMWRMYFRRCVFLPLMRSAGWGINFPCVAKGSHLTVMTTWKHFLWIMNPQRTVTAAAGNVTAASLCSLGYWQGPCSMCRDLFLSLLT